MERERQVGKQRALGHLGQGLQVCLSRTCGDRVCSTPCTVSGLLGFSEARPPADRVSVCPCRQTRGSTPNNLGNYTGCAGQRRG